jgi:hypothetical protein
MSLKNEGDLKICSKCGSTEKYYAKGLCKPCTDRSYRKTNKDSLREKKSKYHFDHQAECNAKSIAWHAAHKEHANARSKSWGLANREKMRAYYKSYYQQHKEKIKKDVCAVHLIRLKTDPEYKLKCALRHRLNMAMKGNAKRGSAVRDLGCSIAELKARLERMFTPEMSWENYGTYWQVDHMIPLSAYDLTDRYQLLEAVHYSNLQPLSIADNHAKGSRCNALGNRLPAQ